LAREYLEGEKGSSLLLTLITLEKWLALF
jgi:hypothetical protein